MYSCTLTSTTCGDASILLGPPLSAADKYLRLCITCAEPLWTHNCTSLADGTMAEPFKCAGAFHASGDDFTTRCLFYSLLVVYINVNPVLPNSCILEEEETPFKSDDQIMVREQNLRALLVLLPAKIMKGVVKAAMEGALLHAQRTATAEAERRRRSLLSTRAEFRHTINRPPKVGVVRHFLGALLVGLVGLLET